MPASPSGNPIRNDICEPEHGERITFVLIPPVVQDLQHLQERTGLSRTDLLNRAVTLYRFIEGQLRERHDLILRDRITGEAQLIRLA
jgi:hypothetical protein